MPRAPFCFCANLFLERHLILLHLVMSSGFVLFFEMSLVRSHSGWSTFSHNVAVSITVKHYFNASKYRKRRRHFTACDLVWQSSEIKGIDSTAGKLPCVFCPFTFHLKQTNSHGNQPQMGTNVVQPSLNALMLFVVVFFYYYIKALFQWLYLQLEETYCGNVLLQSPLSFYHLLVWMSRCWRLIIG